jgi:hypothetical protein
MVKRLECTQTYTGIQWVHEADYDALAARYDHAVELLGLWLDGVCPSQDTEAFLRPADSADAYVGKPVPLAEVLQRTNAVYEAAAAADSASPTNPTEVSSGLVPADQPTAVACDHHRAVETWLHCVKCGRDILDKPAPMAADQQSAADDVQYCECKWPVPREPAGSSLPWCNTCGFDIQPDKT